MLGKGEHGDADVREDEVLRHEVEEVEKVLGGLLGVLGQVVEGVVRLGDAAKQDGHNSSQLKHLRNKSNEMNEKSENKLEECLVSKDSQNCPSQCREDLQV